MTVWRDRFDDEELVSEASIHRMWRGVEAKRGSRQRVWMWPAMGVAAVAAGALLAVLTWEPPAQALRLASGDPLPEHIASPVTLDDNSRIVPEDGVRVLDNRADAWTGLVESGTTRFEVTPGGSRRWTIECGLAQVEVVGTVFEIEREEMSVEVRVERGTVLVRSAYLDDGIRRLEAGQSVRVERESSVETQAVAPELEVEDVVEAVRDTPAAPSEPSAETFASMLARADTARAAGRSEEAERILLDALARYPRHRDRALAWFTVGRIRVSGRRYDDALVAVERALAQGLPQALREDALVRRIECLVRVGRHAEAQQAALEHGALYPNSARRAQIETLLQ